MSGSGRKSGKCLSFFLFYMDCNGGGSLLQIPLIILMSAIRVPVSHNIMQSSILRFIRCQIDSPQTREDQTKKYRKLQTPHDPSSVSKSHNYASLHYSLTASFCYHYMFLDKEKPGFPTKNPDSSKRNYAFPVLLSIFLPV